MHATALTPNSTVAVVGLLCFEPPLYFSKISHFYILRNDTSLALVFADNIDMNLDRKEHI